VDRNEDFDDGDDRSASGGSTYSTSPLPPHERIWRHPSELGFAKVTEADSAPINIGRTGRSLLGVSTVGAAILTAVLFVAIQPTSPDPNAHDVVALTNSELRIASFERAEPVAVGVPSDLPEPPSRSIDKAVGILLPNGQFLVTTMAAIAEVESIDVRLMGGRIVNAQVIQTYPDLSIAVLSVSDKPTSTAFPEIDVLSIVPRGVKFAKGQSVMALLDVPRQLMVSDDINDVLVSLRSTSVNFSDMSNVAEGTPIFDKSGQLVGLCTHINGVLGFIPFIDIEKVLAAWINGRGVAVRK